MKKLNHPILQKCTLLAVCITAISAPMALAQTLVVANLADPDSTVINTGTGEPRTYENDGDLGFAFIVGSSNLLVTNLGLYSPSAGLPGPTGVDLFKLSSDTANATETLVASATVAQGTLPNSKGFAYAPTLNIVGEPVRTNGALLLAGDVYEIYYVDSSKDPFYDATFRQGNGGANTSKLFDTADITPEEDILNGSFGPYPYYIGPNAQFIVGGVQTVPEPASAALLVAGILATLVVAVRRRRLQSL